MRKSIKNKIFITVLIAVIFYSALLFFFDIRLFSKTFSKFSYYTFLSALIYIFIAIALKFLRWSYYLRKSNVKLPLVESILIFFTSLTMSITPGKVGEIVKAQLINKRYTVPKELIYAIVFCERITEFLSLLFIFGFASVLYLDNYYYSSIVFVSLLLIGSLFYIKGFKFVFTKLLQKIPLSQKLLEYLRSISDNTFRLMSIRNLLVVLIISSAAWIFEIIGFYKIMDYYIESSEIGFSFYSYSLSIIIGAVSMIPGGIIATESSLLYLLNDYGLNESSAIVVTLLIRFLTLWLFIIIGIFAYIILLNKQK